MKEGCKVRSAMGKEEVMFICGDVWVGSGDWVVVWAMKGGCGKNTGDEWTMTGVVVVLVN